MAESLCKSTAAVHSIQFTNPIPYNTTNVTHRPQPTEPKLVFTNRFLTLLKMNTKIIRSFQLCRGQLHARFLF